MADHSEPLDIEPCSIEVMENHLLQLETELQEEDNNDDDIISEIEHVKSRIHYWKAARQSKSKRSKKGVRNGSSSKKRPINTDDATTANNDNTTSTKRAKSSFKLCDLNYLFILEIPIRLKQHL